MADILKVHRPHLSNNQSSPCKHWKEQSEIKESVNIHTFITDMPPKDQHYRQNNSIHVYYKTSIPYIM